MTTEKKTEAAMTVREEKALTENMSHDLFSSPEYADLFAKDLKDEMSKISSYNVLPVIDLVHGKKPKFSFETEEGETVETDTLEVSIIAHSHNKALYLEDQNAPECTSIGGVYGTVFGKCASCLNNKWDSGAGGSGKACKDNIALMVAIKGYKGIYEIKIPPTSIKFWNKYHDKELVKLVNELQNKNKGKNKVTNAGFFMVYTEITATSTSKGSKTWSIYNFKCLGRTNVLGDKLMFDSIKEGIDVYKPLYTPTPPSEGNNVNQTMGSVSTVPVNDGSAPFEPIEPSEPVEEAQLVEEDTEIGALFKG